MIKENQIPQEVSTDPEVLKDMFVRFVTALGTGNSKNKKVSELILKIANIYGLQTALDSKITKNVANDGGIIPTYLADGDIDFSTFKIGSFDSAASIGSLTDNGFYTAEGSGSGYENSIMGYVRFVWTINNYQIIGTTGNGLWFREYDGTWSVPRNIGGSTDNVVVTYARAEALAAAGELSPGTVYNIADITVTGYHSILLTAASGSEFFSDGFATLSVPVHRTTGTYTIDGNPVEFKGCWVHAGDTFTAEDIVWYYGKMYASITGARGTASGYSLDTTNWNLLDPNTYPEFYTVVKHNVDYDFATNFVRLEWDEFGNEFGDVSLQIDNFQARYNDWPSLDDMTGMYGMEDNRVTRFYNNEPFSYMRNNGKRYIYNNKNSIVSDNQFNGYAGAIANNTNLTLSNNVLMYESPITGNGYGNNTVVITGCEIGGEIQDNASVASLGAGETFVMTDCRVGKSGDIKRCFGTIIESIIDGDIMDCNEDDSGTMVISYSTIESGVNIDGVSRVWIDHSVVRKNITTTGEVNISYSQVNAAITGTADAKYSNSVVFNAASLYPTETQTVRESVSKITGSAYMGTGQFTVDNGASYSNIAITSGCSVTTIRSNGVKVSSETTGIELEACRKGWHRFKYTASALCSINALDLETIVCVNGTPVQAGYNRKTYPNYDSFINSQISVDLSLNAGDVVTMKYKHGYASPVTFALGQINMELTYAN
jgi:hypothetical protein